MFGCQKRHLHHGSLNVSFGTTESFQTVAKTYAARNSYVCLKDLSTVIKYSFLRLLIEKRLQIGIFFFLFEVVSSCIDSLFDLVIKAIYVKISGFEEFSQDLV